MPPVKFFARLDLDQNPSFLDGHYLPIRFPEALIRIGHGQLADDPAW